MITRDPLQTEKTPYELLSLDRRAGDEAVKRAFSRAIAASKGRRGDLRKLREARSTLFRPVQRALLDILLYDPKVVSRLSPTYETDGSFLGLGARQATAKAWTTHLRAHFPDLPTIHSLAVLWYWWATHEGERFAALAEALSESGVPARTVTTKRRLLQNISASEARTCRPGPGALCPDPDCRWHDECSYTCPPIDVIWRKAIAYWSVLIASHKFWTEQAGLSPSVAGEAREAMDNALREPLFKLRERFERASAPRLASLFRQLEIDLSTELQAAHDMIRAGASLLGPNADGVGCGRLLLKEVDQLEAVRRKVDARLRASGENGHLQGLKLGLTAYADVAQLLTRDRWDDALAQLEKLPQAEQDSAEVRRLNAKALIAKGHQEASVGDVSAALKSWHSALQVTDDHELREEATTAIVSSCLARAATLGKRQTDEAISILEEGRRLVTSRNLDLRLADLLCDQAVTIFNETQEKIKARQGPPTASDIRALEKGLALLERAGPLGSDRARGQITTAQQVLSAVKQAGQPPQWVEWVKKANDAAAREDWSTAITHLRKVIRAAGAKAPATLSKNLATCLANRAISVVNTILSGGSAPTALEVTVLEAAQKDLAEAASLDPTSEHIRTNKNRIDTLLQQRELLKLLGRTTPSTRRRAATARRTTTRRTASRPRVKALRRIRRGGVGWGIGSLLVGLLGVALAWYSPYGTLLAVGAFLSCVGVKLARVGFQSDSQRGWAAVGVLLSMAGVLWSGYRAYAVGGWGHVVGLVSMFVFVVFVVFNQK